MVCYNGGDNLLFGGNTFCFSSGTGGREIGFFVRGIGLFLDRETCLKCYSFRVLELSLRIDVFVKEMIGEMNTISMIFVFNNLILIRFELDFSS